MKKIIYIGTFIFIFSSCNSKHVKETEEIAAQRYCEMAAEYKKVIEVQTEDDKMFQLLSKNYDTAIEALKEAGGNMENVKELIKKNCGNDMESLKSRLK